ncbi:uncharacterized protein [Mytilus edulis]|uniref:uncharacterized protein n=1 Tax=Mytilus edulis TaxID=6550 RepID=UPI0039F0645E
MENNRTRKPPAYLKDFILSSFEMQKDFDSVTEAGDIINSENVVHRQTSTPKSDEACAGVRPKLPSSTNIVSELDKTIQELTIQNKILERDLLAKQHELLVAKKTSGGESSRTKAKDNGKKVKTLKLPSLNELRNQDKVGKQAKELTRQLLNQSSSSSDDSDSDSSNDNDEDKDKAQIKGLKSRRAVLQKEVKLAKGAAFRPGTYSNLKSQLNAYHIFCVYYKFRPFPCIKDILCAYACFLSKSLSSFSSVKNYISGIKTWSHLFGFTVEPFLSTEFKLTLRGLSHKNQHVAVSKLPLLPTHLIDIVRLLNIYDYLDACLWCFLTFAFFGMLRASNLVSRSSTSFNSREQLIRDNVVVSEKGILLLLKWSKTRQNHDYTHQVSLCCSVEPSICPARAYKHLVSLIPGDKNAPVFALPVHGKLLPLSRSVLLNRFRELIVLVGLDPSVYSFHSLRHGGATLATKAGIPEILLKHHGDWRSDCFQTYIKQASVDMYRVTSAMNYLIGS